MKVPHMVGVLMAFSALLAPGAATLHRDADPVVLTGAQVAGLIGREPGRIAAFGYRSGWQQIPVQVDERDLRDLGRIYNHAPVGFSTLVYTDPGTYTGPDGDPLLDADDEIVVMGLDAGDRPPGFAVPPGTVAGTGVEIAVFDPVDGATGYVYLFEQDGSLDPSAGQTRVLYDFDLLSGDYLTTYGLQSGPNPEDSAATTAYYRHHFSDRWIDDGLAVFAGGATGVDILDRHKDQFAPGNCSRTENTFSNGEGAFVVNKSGPVRALRSYLGANSGPLTQRTHLFYERRHDIVTFLRVHPISGVVDYFDYSPNASGMTYFNDRNTAGVGIDGAPETPAAGALSWEMVTGPQGTVVHVHGLDTDIGGLVPTSYYLDAVAPPVTQCTGDPYAYGASGPWFHAAIPCTDPVACPGTAKRVSIVRTGYYGAPGGTVSEAAILAHRAATPLVVDAAPWPPPWPGAVPEDGAAGTPLLASKTVGDDIVLTWGASCAASASAYAVYEGEIGDFASHAPRDCAVPGLEKDLTPAAGDRYYLVVPNDGTHEGSYGWESGGVERSPAAGACHPQLVGACP